MCSFVHDSSTNVRSGYDKKRRRMMECILKILRLYLFRMNCDILLVFAFGFIRECHFKASSIKQRTQIPIGKILCVFITTIFCDFCFRMRSHAKRKNFIMGCIMGLIMGCVVGTNLFNSDWRQWNDGTEIKFNHDFCRKNAK